MKKLTKRQRNKVYRTALQHYLDLDNKRGVCFSLVKSMDRSLTYGVYAYFEELLPEFKRRCEYFRRNNKRWPPYTNHSYRIKTFKQWIKETSPSKK